MDNCELCAAAPITERYHDDELCWIAECESCWVPMIVWKVHDPSPDETTRELLHRTLREVVGRLFEEEIRIDDDMRQIPDHYHAHARAVGSWGRRPLTRRES